MDVSKNVYRLQIVPEKRKVNLSKQRLVMIQS